MLFFPPSLANQPRQPILLTQSQRFFTALAAILLFAIFFANTAQAKTASQLFDVLKPAVYQVQIVDLGSDDKYSIGSGFIIKDDGSLITNYHVVSAYIHQPDKYRIDVIDVKQNRFAAELINFDVIHDLALLKMRNISSNKTDNKSSQADFTYVMPLYDLEPNKSSLNKGQRIFSIGNPHDIAMTIVEGTYNGLLKNSRYQKILFSGALNPGMSGGPAINDQGEVIGINVSKRGEDISFLVPVKFLYRLLEQSSEAIDQQDYQKNIEQLLQQEQQQFFTSLLTQEFESEQLGELTIASNISPSLKCWGHTIDNKEDKKIRHVANHQHCRSQDSIYVEQDFRVGDFSYSYEWVTTEELNRLQFYSLLEDRFEHSASSTGYDIDKLTEYQCNTQFIELAGHRWKASSCFRAYKQYTNLYDVHLVLVSVDENNKAALIKLSASGISRDNSQKLMAKFLAKVAWPAPSPAALDAELNVELNPQLNTKAETRRQKSAGEQ